MGLEDSLPCEEERISDKLPLGSQFSELEVEYKKETVYGSDILSECKRESRELREYSHRILDDQGKNELAIGRTTWKIKTQTNQAQFLE